MFGFGRRIAYLGWRIALGQMSLVLDYKGETKYCLLKPRKVLGSFLMWSPALGRMAKGTLLEMIII